MLAQACGNLGAIDEVLGGLDEEISHLFVWNSSIAL
jgi:hypothetical protein